VKLHRAARAEKVSFRQLHGSSGSRVKQIYVPEDDQVSVRDEEIPSSSADFKAHGPQALPYSTGSAPARSLPEPVPIRGRTSSPPPMPEPPPPTTINRSELVKGYEYSKGMYVTVTKEDLEKIAPPTAREIQILEFVKLAEIDPIYFETSYYVTPDRAGERPYALLYEALLRSGYVAIAQFAMHNREHIVTVRSGRSGIIAHTMFYETEIRREDEYHTDTAGIPERELSLALKLIEGLGAPFDPAKYHDRYKEKLEAMIAAKISGHETVEPPTPKAKPVPDMLAALERSLELVRKPAASESKTEPAPTKRKKTK